MNIPRISVSKSKNALVVKCQDQSESFEATPVGAKKLGQHLVEQHGVAVYLGGRRLSHSLRRSIDAGIASGITEAVVDLTKTLKPGTKVFWKGDRKVHTIVEFQAYNGIGGSYWLKSEQGLDAVAGRDEILPLEGIQWTFAKPKDGNGDPMPFSKKRWIGETAGEWTFAIFHRRGWEWTPYAINASGTSPVSPFRALLTKKAAQEACEEFLRANPGEAK